MILSIVLALVASPVSIIASGTVHVAITGRNAPSQLQKRQNTNTSSSFEAASYGSLDNRIYIANVTVGTPPQALQVQIDTGSTDIWFISSDADVTDEVIDSFPAGMVPGTFDSDESTSFVRTDHETAIFNTTYVDGGGSSGDFFQDTFTIGNVTLESLQMALANSTTTYPVMGIGYTSGESSAPNFEYPNLLDALVAKGTIATQAYSLWLNDLESRTGSLLFGGVDTAKYHGDLASLRTHTVSSPAAQKFIIGFTSVSITTRSGTSSVTPSDFVPISALLDSGTTSTVLPDDIAIAIFEIIGAVSHQGTPYVSCAFSRSQATFNFGFGGQNGPVIKVPISEMMRPNFNSDSGDDAVCQLLIGQSSAYGGRVMMGDSFLRSAYVVFDLANNRIAMAQTNFDAFESTIVPFESANAEIPGATSVQGEPTSGVGRTAASSTFTNTEPVFTGTAASAFSSDYASVSAAMASSSPSGTTAVQPSPTVGTGTSTTKPGAGNSIKPLGHGKFVLIGLNAVFLALGGLVLV